MQAGQVLNLLKRMILKDTIISKNFLRLLSNVTDLDTKTIKSKFSEKELMYTYQKLRHHGLQELKYIYNIPNTILESLKHIHEKCKSVETMDDLISNIEIDISELEKICSIVKKEKCKKNANIIASVVGKCDVENIRSAVGIRIGINHVSWCDVDIDNSNLNVLSWQTKTFYEVNLSTCLLEIMKTGMNIANSIPNRNIYLMEKDKVILKTTNATLYKLRLRQQQLASVILTVLFQRNSKIPKDGEETTCIMMRPLTTARCFNLYHGVETVSSELVLKSILRKQYNGLKNISSLNIDNNIMTYYKTLNKYDKEELNRVLLLTLAFFDKAALR